MKQWGVEDLMPHLPAFWCRPRAVTHLTARHDDFHCHNAMGRAAQ